MDASQRQVEATVRDWLREVVIGLGLCPFAAQPTTAGRVHVVVSSVAEDIDVLDLLQRELDWLAEHAEAETTLIVLTKALSDFLEYNAFLDAADALVERCGWDGVFQVASFHPRYRFADCGAEDPANFTARAPYPILHLLREDSVEAALEHYDGDPSDIPERNVVRMRSMTPERLRALFPWCFAPA